jgi:hypothetical protein
MMDAGRKVICGLWAAKLRIFMFAAMGSKILLIVPTDRKLKQYKNYKTCSDMFRFTQEPSSGSSLVLS